MPTTLKEQAWQSGLVLLDETPEWHEDDWSPLVGGARERHASVVLDHDNTDHKRRTVLVMGGYDAGWSTTNSVLVMNLEGQNKQWREGPPMNQKRCGHAALVCNGGVYVMGGYSNGAYLDCMERIDSNYFLQSSSTSSIAHERNWTTLTCHLSEERWGCGAVAVHNRYIIVMGGYSNRYLSSVDIIDTSNDTVTAGPSMTVPRQWCASAVIGHRIFVVGGHGEHGFLDTVEYLDYATPCDNHETKKETGSTFISFSSTWTTHSELRLSNTRSACAMVAVGSCLVVAGGNRDTVEVLDTYRNYVWNLPPLSNSRRCCSMVTVANQVAVIGGGRNSTCATLPLMDRNSWCFRQLCEQQSNGWYHSLEGVGLRDDDISPFSTSTSTRSTSTSSTHRGDEGKDEA